MKKEKFTLLDPDSPPIHLHVGLRMIKTVLAVYICAMIGYFRGQVTIFSLIAAVLCMQPTPEKTLIIAFNRTMGTLVGGLFGLAALLLSIELGIFNIPWLYYLIVSLLIIPIMMTTLLMKKPTISAFTCIVFFSICFGHTSSDSSVLYAFGRVIDTMVGIVVAMVINLTLPNHSPELSKKADEPADPEPVEQEPAGEEPEAEAQPEDSEHAQEPRAVPADSPSAEKEETI